jgi:hypothetical protein
MTYIRYQVLDQNGLPIRGSHMFVQESISNVYVNGIGPDNSNAGWKFFDHPEYSGSSKHTDSTGTYLDVPFGSCASSVPFVSSATQSFRVV